MFISGGSISNNDKRLLSSEGSSPPFSIMRRQFVSQSTSFPSRSATFAAARGFVINGKSSLRLVLLSLLIGSAIRRQDSSPL